MTYLTLKKVHWATALSCWKLLLEISPITKRQQSIPGSDCKIQWNGLLSFSHGDVTLSFKWEAYTSPAPSGIKRILKKFVSFLGCSRLFRFPLKFCHLSPHIFSPFTNFDDSRSFRGVLCSVLFIFCFVHRVLLTFCIFFCSNCRCISSHLFFHSPQGLDWLSTCVCSSVLWTHVPLDRWRHISL